MIYFDNAATTLPKPPEVKEAVCRALDTMGNADRGVHDASLGTMRTIYHARELARQNCSASPHPPGWPLQKMPRRR